MAVAKFVLLPRECHGGTVNIASLNTGKFRMAINRADSLVVTFDAGVLLCGCGHDQGSRYGQVWFGRWCSTNGIINRPLSVEKQGRCKSPAFRTSVKSGWHEKIIKRKESSFYARRAKIVLYFLSYKKQKIEAGIEVGLFPVPWISDDVDDGRDMNVIEWRGVWWFPCAIICGTQCKVCHMFRVCWRGDVMKMACHFLTLIVLMWRIGWAHNNARK